MSRFVRANVRAMSGYVPGEQPPAGKFIKLNTNENPYPPSPAVVQAIQASVAESTLPPYPDPSAAAFRRRAAELLDVQPDWILCGNGSDDILTICVTRALVGQGQALAYALCRVTCCIGRWPRSKAPNVRPVRFLADWSLPAAFASNQPEAKVVFLAEPEQSVGQHDRAGPNIGVRRTAVVSASGR